jgi:hypothetical protein
LLGGRRSAALALPISLSSCLSPRTRIDSHAFQALPQMIVRIFLILSSTLERPHPRIPLVVPAPAVAGPRDPESGIPAWKVGLRMDYVHHQSCLRSLHVADERPKKVQAELHGRGSEDAPTPVRSPLAPRASDA